MLKKLFLLFMVILTCLTITNAQGTIKGTVTDDFKDPLAYSTVILRQENRVLKLSYTDSKGKYEILDIPAGIYDIEVIGSIGCSKSVTQTDIHIEADDVKSINFEINCDYLPPLLID